MDNLISISAKTLESNGFAASRSGATSGTRFGDMSNGESGALKSPTLLDSIIRAKVALCDHSDPVTGAMPADDIRAWWDLSEIQDFLIQKP